MNLAPYFYPSQRAWINDDSLLWGDTGYLPSKYQPLGPSAPALDGKDIKPARLIQ